jgi:hypothetical protein
LKIMLATLSNNTVRREYCSSILTEAFLAPERLHNQQRYDLAFNIVCGNNGLSKDRSIVASSALAMAFDWLVFIDSDQSWTWPDLRKLVDSDRDIIAGITPMKKRPLVINFTPMERDNECFEATKGVANPSGLKKLIAKYPTQDEIEVLLVGTGFVAIRVTVLEEMSKTAQPFKYIHPQTGQEMTCYEFFPSGAANGIYWGEDFAFSRNVRHAGYKIFINHTCQVGHYGDGAYHIRDEP